jgi:hypothetical protein
MAGTDPSRDPTQLLADEAKRALDELVERLTAELSAKDKDAVTTALKKAAVAGAQVGAMVMYARREADPEASPITVNWEFALTDAWAREYEDGQSV